jgi:large subunit ribosomal protein L15
MKIHEIAGDRGRQKRRKRVGRGEGSGHGGTSCHGHKGQRARSGGVKGAPFEGGQMPLVRRVPKRGFRNIFGTEYQAVNVSVLNRFKSGTVVDAELLVKEGLVKGKGALVKILGDGELKKKLTVRADAFSKSAQEKIAAAGGTSEVATGEGEKVARGE